MLSFALLFAVLWMHREDLSSPKVLYVISGFATMTLGRDTRIEELSLSQHFDNIPRRCFSMPKPCLKHAERKVRCLSQVHVHRLSLLLW